MAHTLLEQEHTFSSFENSASEINDIFAQQFGYTQSGDYYFSPVDTDFGVRWYINNSYLKCAVTFDGGVTETELVYNKPSVSAIYYHVSKNEKVVSLRIKYNTSYLADVVIAHDEKNKTVCFKGSTTYGVNPNPSYNYVDMLDYKKIIIEKDYPYQKKYKVNVDISNAIYRYPSLNNQCLCSELYGVINVQVFISLNITYINFYGQVYRVISCFLINSSTSNVTNYYIPYFAFPVSD